jgi:PAS domain S-box-containing protein
MFFYTSPALGWKICAVIPKQEIDLEVARFVYRVMGTLALSLSLMGLLTMVGVRRFIIKPIEELEQNTQTIIQTGNLDHRIAVETKDEIGQLATSFNEMVESIKKTEEDLRESEEKYRSLVENINVGIFSSTIEPGGRLLHANPAVAKIMGYESVSEMKNLSLVNLYLDSAERDSLIQQLGKGEPLKDYEVRLVRKDGVPIWASLSVTAQRDRDGNISRLEGVVEDITARRQAEEALLRARDELEIKVQERTAELEKANEELDAFAHTVAHDLKGPLGPLVGFSETLEYMIDSLEADQVEKSLHTIVQNARKMNSITDELLLLASVRKQEEIELEPLDMAAIVAEAQNRLAYLLEEQEVEIVLPDVWPEAVGYGPWIEEVWVNYISNAVKYGGQPPRLELGGERQEDGLVRFWVRDNGRGLTVEEQEKVFIPFSRLDQVRAKGYGLGLSIVQRIIERLGCQVSVESEIGQGSTFSFTLPAALPEATPSP